MITNCSKCDVLLVYDNNSLNTSERPVERNGIIICTGCDLLEDLFGGVNYVDKNDSKKTSETKKEVFVHAPPKYNWFCPNCKIIINTVECSCGKKHILFDRKPNKKKKKKNKK